MTHKERIANYLKSGRMITKKYALKKIGSWRLGARIYDLRRDGMNIVTTKNRNGDIAYRLLSYPFRPQTRRGR